ncbi:unnamed protein product [Eretmochelys imbricata]
MFTTYRPNPDIGKTLNDFCIRLYFKVFFENQKSNLFYFSDTVKPLTEAKHGIISSPCSASSSDGKPANCLHLQSLSDLFQSRNLEQYLMRTEFLSRSFPVTPSSDYIINKTFSETVQFDQCTWQRGIAGT